MKNVSLSGSPRENVGKKDAKKNRREGKVPCVLYGGKEQIHFIAEEKDFMKIIFTPEVFIIKLNINGNEKDVILQDIQYHPVTDRILHVDFLEIIPGKPVTIAIPVSLTGNAPGVIKGGKLKLKIRKMRVAGLAEDLPDQIVLDISELDIGNSIRVNEVENKNLRFLDNPTSIVVGVFAARGAAADEEEEGEEGTEGAEEAPATE